MDTDQRTVMNNGQSTRPVLQQTEWTTDESLCISVVRAVAAVSNRTLTELPPLYEAIDPEALEELVESSQRRHIEVEFRYYGHLITVTGDGEISVSRPIDEA